MKLTFEISAASLLLANITSCHSRQVEPICATIQESRTDSIQTNTRRQFSPDILIVSYDGNVGEENVRKAAKVLDAEIVYEYQNFNIFAVRKPNGLGIDETLQYFKSTKGVLNAVEDQMCEIDNTADEIRM